MTLEERLDDHVYRLAAEHGCAVNEYDLLLTPYARLPVRGAFNAETGAITFLPIRCDVSYTVALHEIGHIVMEHPHDHDGPWILRREAEAWLWAFERSLVGVTSRMRAFAGVCFSTYLEAALLCPGRFRPPFGLDEASTRSFLEAIGDGPWDALVPR